MIKRNYNDQELPHWLKNLSKAWEANRESIKQRRVNEKSSKQEQESFRVDENCTPMQEMDQLKKYLDDHQPELKPKLGRPNMSNQERKQPKVKRSEQMRQLLQDNGVEIDECGSLVGHIGWIFLPNGRVRYEDTDTTIAVSAYEFITDYL